MHPCRLPTHLHPAGKVTAAEYLTDFEGDSATTIAAVGAFASPHPLDWAAFTDVTLESMVLADVNHDKGLDHTEFYGFLNPEGGCGAVGCGWVGVCLLAMCRLDRC